MEGMPHLVPQSAASYSRTSINACNDVGSPDVSIFTVNRYNIVMLCGIGVIKMGIDDSLPKMKIGQSSPCFISIIFFVQLLALKRF